MTEQEQRISIAEACGWKLLDTTSCEMHFPGGWQETAVKRWFSPNSNPLVCAGFEFPPDYLNDLNAMHSAELWLIYAHPDLENAYNRELAKVTHGLNTVTSGGQPSFYVTLLRRATANQRCEAFCRVMWPEKWKKQHDPS